MLLFNSCINFLQFTIFVYGCFNSINILEVRKVKNNLTFLRSNFTPKIFWKYHNHK